MWYTERERISSKRNKKVDILPMSISISQDTLGKLKNTMLFLCLQVGEHPNISSVVTQDDQLTQDINQLCMTEEVMPQDL